MLLTRKIFTPISRHSRNFQVTVLGGATEIGQTVSLLLRGQTNISNLIIHDVKDYTAGVAMDLSHVPTKTNLQGFVGDENLYRALEKSDVVIAIGGTITPGETIKQRMKLNSNFIRTVSAAVAKLIPQPFYAIATEPINCLVPMAAEVMRNNGQCDPKKLFGITTIDALRAQTLYASENNLNPQTCVVPVVGGHSSYTTIPLLSQATPNLKLTDKTVQEFTTRFSQCNDRIIHAKRGWGPTLSVAYGVLNFTGSLLDALAGHPAHVNAFVENNDFGTSFFSGLVHLNNDGVKEMQRYTEITPYECYLLERCIEQLRRDILYGQRILEMA